MAFPATRRTSVRSILVFLLALIGLPVAAQEWLQVTTLLKNSNVFDRLKQPGGVAIARNGDVYVADTGHHAIQRIALDGTVTTFGAGGLKSPGGIAIDEERGLLYVADTGNHVLRRITLTGELTTLAGSGTPGDRDGLGSAARFHQPAALAVAANGTVFVADSGNHKIRAITPEGVVTTVAGRGTPGFADGALAQALFQSPGAIAVGEDGAITVADTKNHRIRRIANGVVVTVAGTGQPGRSDGAALAASFQHPGGVAVLADGTLIVADTQNHLIRAIANGTVTTLSGTGKPGHADGSDLLRAQFAQPGGLAAAGFIAVADTQNSAIRLLIPVLQLLGVDPPRGPLAGGNEVLVRGAGFLPGRTSVRFGNSDATSTFLSSTELRAVVPAGPGSGPVDVTVTTTAGTKTLTAGYMYLVPPTIVSVEPNKGTTGGGDTVTVYGSELVAGDTTVQFGDAEATNVSVVSPSSLTLTTPAHAAGVVDVQLATPAGSATAPGAFRYLAPPSIHGFVPEAGRIGASVVITGTNFDEEPAGNTVRFGGLAASVVSASATELLVTVPAGATSAPVSVTTAGGTAASAAPFTIIAYTRVDLAPATLSLRPGESADLTATATTPDGETVNVTALATWTSSDPDHVSVTAGHVTAIADGSATITATVAGLSVTATVAVASQQLPGDPAQYAPEPDATIVAPLPDRIRFLYTGPDAIQSDVAPGVITDERVAVIRGAIRARGGQPLPGVRVAVLDHPELGSTLTRADGRYDLAVNGGGPLTLRFTRNGYIAADRLLTTRWNEQLVAPDVVLIPYDANVTVIAANAPAAQVARGGIISDEDGTRRATIYVPAQTGTSLVLPDGSTVPAAELHVRATEFTVGADGPRAMPAPLPPSSGYTYCVELSADEAAAAGASEVRFSKPLSLYVENFIGFPAGTVVPLGYYDRTRGTWIGAENGRVLKILGITDGEATIDSNGDAQADSETTLAALGLDATERAMLATLYAPGQTLWRLRIGHFTPWDANWPYAPPFGATAPDDAGGDWIPAPTGDSDPNGQACGWSTIDCKNQTLGESIAIAGTPFTLEYNSSRVAKTQYKMTIRATGTSVPANVKRVEVRITVAGRSFESTYAPGTNLEETFVWDGRDAYGKPVQGAAHAAVNVAYVYQAVYTNPIDFAMAWAVPGTTTLNASRARAEVTMGKTFTLDLGHFAMGETGFGDWSLSAQSFYDGNGRVIYESDGSQRGGDPRRTGDAAMYTAAGSGGCCDTGDGGAAGLANLAFPTSVASGADGSVYLVDLYKIKKVDPNGVITTIAGSASNGFTPDGMPALGSRIWPWDLALGPDDTVYFNDIRNNRVRRIVNGVLETVAGNGATSGNAPDGALATSVPVFPAGIAVGPDGMLYIAQGDIRMVGRDGILRTLVRDPDGMLNADRIAVGPDGSVYVTSGFRNTIHRVTPDGRITRIASNLRAPQGLTVAEDGTVLVSERDTHVITAIAPDGTKSRFAGNGLRTAGGEGAIARSTPASFPMDARVAPDGSVLMAISGENKIRRTLPVFPPAKASTTYIPARDGSIAYVFVSGRHVRTVDTLTGTTLLTLDYDANGFLVKITDGEANVTTIERDGQGNATAIIAPAGQRTQLTVSSGKLTQIAGPTGTHRFTYNAAGLLATLVDPRDGMHRFTYDDDGLLTKDEDPVGGFIALTRSGRGRNYTVTRESAEGRSQSYAMGVTTDNTATRLNTGTDGLARNWSRLGATTTVTQPDGTRFVTTEGADPRFGAAAPIVASSAVTLPSGLTSTTTATATAVLSDPGDPFSVVSLVDEISVNGRKFTSTYTSATSSITMRSAAGRTSTMTLDAKGRASQVSVATLAPVTYAYTASGEVGSIATGSRSYSFGYNARRELTSVTDPLSRTVRFTYDDAGRVLTQTLSDGRVIAFTYDADGNLTSVTPPSRPAHVMTWTPIGLLSTYVPPAVDVPATTHYAYDRDRRLSLITRADGSLLTPGYDTAGRMTSLDTPAGAVTWSYDAATGALTTATDAGGGSVRYTYDGPLMKSVTWTGSVAGSVSLGYDSSFRPTTEVAAGSSIAFTYDIDSLLTKAGALTLTRSATTGLLSGTTLGSVSDTRTYNTFGEATGYSATFGATPIASFTYTRDDVGRITKQTSTLAGVASTSDYGYDAAGRLTSVVTNGVTTTYGYDANGNRLGGFYDAQDRLTSFNGTSYSYNANGELTGKDDLSGHTSYTYDSFGNLRTVALPNGSSIAYVVDANNRRIGRKVNGTLTQGWLYSGQLRIVAELDGTGAVAARFVYGTRTNVPDYMVKAGATYRIISDHLGSPRMVVNTATGALIQSMTYDAFGNVLTDTNPGFQPFGFAGGLYDRATGLTRFGARDYDPRVGRWTTKDPIGFAAGDGNLYGYVHNDPVNFRDPSGTDEVTADPHMQEIILKLWESAQWGHNSKEVFAFVIKDPQSGAYSCKQLPATYEQNKFTIKEGTEIPENTIAVIHTHPNKRTSEPDDPGDRAAATAFHRMRPDISAIYTISKKGVGKYVPGAKKGTQEENSLNFPNASTDGCGCPK